MCIECQSILRVELKRKEGIFKLLMSLLDGIGNFVINVNHINTFAFMKGPATKSILRRWCQPHKHFSFYEGPATKNI